MKSKLALILISSVMFGGCATILKGKTQQVTILSNVEGAEIMINGESIGKTPYTGQIKRASDMTLTLSKVGYQAKTVTIDTTVEPIFFGNVVSGGPLGMTTDFGTGSMYKVSNSTINIDLVSNEKK